MRFDAAAQAYIQLLIEGRIDDLKTGNPHLVNEIDAYSNQDPTPQKKFVPWLVSQHKKGNVTPTDPELHQTLTGFETYKSRHGIKDHSSKSFQEIKAAVAPHLGTAATNKELKRQQIHEGINHIFSSDDGNIHAFHVKTKEASQHVYGGGKNLGGLHTDWCVSSRSDQCAFGDYGTMYTIHVKDDKKSPYAVHLGGKQHDRITTRDNYPDEYELGEGLAKFPHLKDAIHNIKNQHQDIKKSEDAEFLRKLKSNDQNITVDVINNAARHTNPEIAMAVLHHAKADNRTTRYAAENPNPEVAIAALRHPSADNRTTQRAARHSSQEVAMAALNHPDADNVTTQRAAENPNPEVAIAALRHSKADNWTAEIATEHPNPEVRNIAKSFLYS